MDPDELIRACGPRGRQTWLCETTYRITGSKGAAEVADTLSTPLRIVLVVVVALVVVWIVHRVANRVAGRLRRVVETAPGADERRAQRAETIRVVLRSVSTLVIWTIAFVIILGELGVDLAPLLAGAGVLGLVIGFGAQSIVRDFLAGFFVLIEDQYGVGDVIDVGDASGTVEDVSLRVTRLRDVEGVVWYVPNGEIQAVGNKSQQWARALLDIAVARDTDIATATGVIRRVADEMWHEEPWSDLILDEPEVWGVEEIGVDRILIRVVVKTRPLKQWDVARELRARVATAFEEAGIALPYTQQRITYSSAADVPEPVRGERAGGAADADREEDDG